MDVATGTASELLAAELDYHVQVHVVVQQTCIQGHKGMYPSLPTSYEQRNSPHSFQAQLLSECSTPYVHVYRVYPGLAVWYSIRLYDLTLNSLSRSASVNTRFYEDEHDSSALRSPLIVRFSSVEYKTDLPDRAQTSEPQLCFSPRPARN